MAPDSKLMVVALRPEGYASLAPSTPHELFTLPALDIGLHPYEVTQDGQRFS